MRISTEREFGFSAGKADSRDASAADLHGNGATIVEPFVAANDVSEAEAALIVAYAQSLSRQSAPDTANQSLSAISRAMDIAIAAVLLVVLLPVLLTVALYLKILERGPVFFAHRRIGLGGKPFYCLKFRTMCVDANQRLTLLLAQDENLLREWNSTQKLLRDPRVTRFGRILRNSSLDELPQLINVLRGDMSLVGPRPVVEDELRRYGRYAVDYMSVRPGLTGLWQVTRDCETSYRRRVASDVYYVRNKSLGYDFRILLATIPAVLIGNG